MSEKDRVQKVALEAEATMNDPLPEDAPSIRPNKTVPVSVRLAPPVVVEIEELAQRLDIPASTLLRGWIQQGLAEHHDTTVARALDQLAADLQRLRQIVT
jgi:predicted transcriptional regulator